MRWLIIVLLIFFVSACGNFQSAGVVRHVKYALERDARTTQTSFEVIYQGEGEIVIYGNCSSGMERAAVTEIAREVRGVMVVVNNCIAPPTAEELIRDSLISNN